MKNLFEAIEDEGQPPCKKFACQKVQLCADEKLACTAFAYFVQTGRTIHPHNFVNARANGKSRVDFVGEVHPTRALFSAIQNDRWSADHGGDETTSSRYAELAA